MPIQCRHLFSFRYKTGLTAHSPLSVTQRHFGVHRAHIKRLWKKRGPKASIFSFTTPREKIRLTLVAAVWRGTKTFTGSRAKICRYMPRSGTLSLTCLRICAAIWWLQSKMMRNSRLRFISLSRGLMSCVSRGSWRIFSRMLYLDGAIISSCSLIRPEEVEGKRKISMYIALLSAVPAASRRKRSCNEVNTARRLLKDTHLCCRHKQQWLFSILETAPGPGWHS